MWETGHRTSEVPGLRESNTLSICLLAGSSRDTRPLATSPITAVDMKGLVPLPKRNVSSTVVCGSVHGHPVHTRVSTRAYICRKCRRAVSAQSSTDTHSHTPTVHGRTGGYADADADASHRSAWCGAPHLLGTRFARHREGPRLQRHDTQQC
jgi:hypothetical protein